MKTFIRHVLTADKDSTVWDLTRCVVAVALINALALQNFVVIWRGQAFDIGTFGAGIGAIIGAGGLAMWARKDIELSNEPAK